MDNIDVRRRIINHFKRILHFKEKLPNLKSKDFKINQIIYRDYKLIGIIKDAKDFAEDICFKFYVSEDEIEHLVGGLKCYHIQANGLAQVYFFKLEGVGDYLDKAAQYCFENQTFIPDKHRLELVIPKEIEKIKIKEIRNILNSLNLIV